MKHFPIFIALEGRRVVLSGGGDAALAKLRLLMKTEAHLIVHAPAPVPEILDWAKAGRLTLIRRALEPGDALDAALFYAADEDAAEDARTVALARADGALTNTVDNLQASQFITPAIVDRDPVTVAIGTEGTAPVLARAIKADIEAMLPARLGPLARAARRFRALAEALPMGRARRAFWSEFFFAKGPAALDRDPGADLGRVLTTQLNAHMAAKAQPGRVTFAVIAADDPELLPLKTRNALHGADLVLHHADISPAILELARREAVFAPLADADAMIDAARSGQHVLSLAAVPPTPALFGALHLAGIDATVIPGIAPLPSLTLLKESA
jgi:uroporphyrin-III C-methyltransferase/precorrin-2 dehydrogenase/sirohydrochlorin ferrochelatase